MSQRTRSVASVVLGVLLAANLMVAGARLIKPVQAAATLRYKIVSYDQTSREAILNQYAKDGWELVAIEPAWGGFIFEKQ